MTELESTFISLVKLGIGTSTEESIPLHTDWESLRALADEQGLSAVVLDGIEQLLEGQRPPQLKLLTWIGQVMQGYERYYEAYLKAVVELAVFYNAHGLKMMLLKGLACGRDWPNPSHRPYGDIDVWLFGKQKESDADLTKERGVKIDKSHHHHTVFNWGEFTVENHYDFVNVHAHLSSAKLEQVFKELGKDDSHFVEIKDSATGSATKIYLPSPNLHALFLIKHLSSHFVGSNITLRQLMDWAFFVEKHSDTIDWVWLNGKLVDYHMRDFTNCLNAICVEDLGFNSSFFPEIDPNPDLKERVLLDILNPQFSSAELYGFAPRMIYKYKRWQGNAWKHELCYNESRLSAFLTGIWAKILKPASI